MTAVFLVARYRNNNEPEGLTKVRLQVGARLILIVEFVFKWTNTTQKLLSKIRQTK